MKVNIILYSMIGVVLFGIASHGHTVERSIAIEASFKQAAALTLTKENTFSARLVHSLNTIGHGFVQTIPLYQRFVGKQLSAFFLNTSSQARTSSYQMLVYY